MVKYPHKQPKRGVMCVTFEQAIKRNLRLATWIGESKSHIYLGYDPQKGWSIQRLGFLQRIFRCLGFYASTHSKNLRELQSCYFRVDSGSPEAQVARAVMVKINSSLERKNRDLLFVY